MGQSLKLYQIPPFRLNTTGRDGSRRERGDTCRGSNPSTSRPSTRRCRRMGPPRLQSVKAALHSSFPWSSRAKTGPSRTGHIQTAEDNYRTRALDDAAAEAAERTLQRRATSTSPNARDSSGHTATERAVEEINDAATILTVRAPHLGGLER